MRSLKPLKDMKAQWVGFLSVCGILLGVAVYNWARLQGQVDTLDRETDIELEALRLDVQVLKNTCQHVSPVRMLNIDTKLNEHQKSIDRLKKRR